MEDIGIVNESKGNNQQQVYRNLKLVRLKLTLIKSYCKHVMLKGSMFFYFSSVSDLKITFFLWNRLDNQQIVGWGLLCLPMW